MCKAPSWWSTGTTRVRTTRMERSHSSAPLIPVCPHLLNAYFPNFPFCPFFSCLLLLLSLLYCLQLLIFPLIVSITPQTIFEMVSCLSISYFSIIFNLLQIHCNSIHFNCLIFLTKFKRFVVSILPFIADFWKSFRLVKNSLNSHSVSILFLGNNLFRYQKRRNIRLIIKFSYPFLKHEILVFSLECKWN